MPQEPVNKKSKRFIELTIFFNISSSDTYGERERLKQ